MIVTTTSPPLVGTSTGPYGVSTVVPGLTGPYGIARILKIRTALFLGHNPR
ncbi:hypothetical protein [Leuconostoc mesenteroides]|uniref:hypothetical protein n=1 Tax=Leuconostoc mesenteroides TaxID=1245 RepID=UPI0020CBF8DA|nr:hypothetical protein [Leuconostoc mesenteroides]MCP9302323.1 hypothetical protein [Leuconostoc mesenteroides]MCP9326950.1 hypothetical protein [Leuconostoc mesenteroides]